MKSEFSLGNSPLFGDSTASCHFTPGFQEVDRFKDSDLKKCWPRHEARCRYNFNTFKRTNLYMKLRPQNNDKDLEALFPSNK